MKLINSNKRYYHTLLGVTIEKDIVYSNKAIHKAFVPSGKSALYWSINGNTVSKKNLLNERFLVMIYEKEILPF